MYSILNLGFPLHSCLILAQLPGYWGHFESYNLVIILLRRKASTHLLSVPSVFLSKSLVLNLGFREPVIYLKLYKTLCVYKWFSYGEGSRVFNRFSRWSMTFKKSWKPLNPLFISILTKAMLIRTELCKITKSDFLLSTSPSEIWEVQLLTITYWSLVIRLYYKGRREKWILATLVFW